MVSSAANVRSGSKTIVFHIVNAVLILGLTWLAYSNSLKGVFFLDDAYHLLNYPVTASDALSHLISHPFVPGREIVNITFAANRYVHGADVFGYHLVNVAIHSLNALLMYLLIQMVLTRFFSAGNHISAQKIRFSALFGTLVFAIHPLTTACVNYTVQRYTLLSGFFYLLGVVCFLVAGNRSAKMKWICYAACALCAWMALHCKEAAITFPLMIFFFTCLQASGDGVPAKKQIAGIAGGLIAFAVFAVVELYLTGWFESSGARLWSPWQQFQAESEVFVHYWKMLLLPLDRWMNIDHDFAIHNAPIHIHALLAIMAHAVIGLAAWRLLRNGRKAAVIGIGWFYISLLPYGFVPEGDLMVNYKTYYPLMGFAFIVADFTIWITRKENLSMAGISAAALGVIVLLTTATHDRNRVYRNDLTLWEDTVQKSPFKARVLNNRGVAYYDRGMTGKALADFTQSIAFGAEYARAYENRGCLYFDRKQFRKARCDFEAAVSLNVKTARSYTNLGAAYMELNDLEKSMECFDRAIEVDPGYAEAYYNRGLANMKAMQWVEAIMDFDDVLRIDPENGAAYEKRGQLVLSIDQEAACADFKDACNLGECYHYDQSKARGVCP